MLRSLTKMVMNPRLPKPSSLTKSPRRKKRKKRSKKKSKKTTKTNKKRKKKKKKRMKKLWFPSFTSGNKELTLMFLLLSLSPREPPSMTWKLSAHPPPFLLVLRGNPLSLKVFFFFYAYFLYIRTLFFGILCCQIRCTVPT